MTKSIASRSLPWLLFASMAATSAHAAGNKVVIGDIDDMSGLYADVIGPGGVEAAKMAIEDFGGSVLGTQKRQDVSVFALTYSLRLRSCKLIDAFVTSSWSPTIRTSRTLARKSSMSGPT